ncbi:MAG: PQQ-like beta-propeller repeat protein [Planctomyces sp.]|nr:PQQ-like beta-propeller repeat protein [Planctomyces sp.]
MSSGRRSSLSATLVAALFCTATLSVIAADWPQWRGLERDGRSTEAIRRDWDANPPAHLWTVEGMGRGYASVAVVDGRLYTVGNRDNAQCIICVDAESGRPIWSSKITDSVPRHDYEGSRSTPTVDGDKIYAVSSDGGIACLNLADGSPVWRRSFRDFGGQLMSGWGFSEGPLVDGDNVICTPGGPNAVMVALNKATGKDVWRCAMPRAEARGRDGAGYSSIVVSNAGGVKQYVQTVGHGVIGVRARDGKFLWGYDKVANDVANIPTPLVSGDHVFASTGYGAGAALLKLNKAGDGIRPEEVYFLQANVFQNHHGGMVLDGDVVYAGHGHGQGFPTCLNWRTGKVVWGGSRQRGPGEGSAALTQVGDGLLFRYQNGVLALIDASPQGYKLLGTLTPDYQEGDSWSHPVVVNGKMYLREQDRLMCYDVSASGN